MRLAFPQSGSGRSVLIKERDRVLASVAEPVACHFLDGSRHTGGYDAVEAVSEHAWRGTATWRHADLEVALVDDWALSDPEDSLTLRRRLTTTGKEVEGAGLQLRLDVRLESVASPQFFVPAMVYSRSQWLNGRLYSYSDHRLAYPLVSAFDPDSHVTVTLARSDVARTDSAPQRRPGQSHFLHCTGIGSVGFSTTADGAPTLHAAWPYREADTSAMLDSNGTPASAYFPIGANATEATVTYEIRRAPAADYVAAITEAVRPVLDSPDLSPTPLPVPLHESIRLRLESVAKTYREWDDGFAGFVLNFDPEQGYDSTAKAFGASFTDHEMSNSRDILEYGFTGRQLNLAYMLTMADPDGWTDKAASMVDSFARRMATDSGWVYTLWHAGHGRPLYACGDPAGTVMHYLGRSEVPGTYTRMMAEAGSDLLLNVQWRRSHGEDRADWLAVCVGLADFFTRHQDSDGGWYRAYAPDGRPVTGSEWFGVTLEAAKTATSTVIPFLLGVADLLGSAGDLYRVAARRAGDYVLRHQVASDEYRGGTLDNPNVVDKEAAFLAMRALLALHTQSGEPALLEGARRAASVAITWHSLWEVPNVPGTSVHRAAVRSVGWGGINSTWGAGVTDIYSLFFIADLHRLGELVEDDSFCRVAELIACSSLQLLSVPGRLYGMADTGMQPEGISFCSQGLDDGLITKGDRWGGLGWPYTAGTYGLHEYLVARGDESQSSSVAASYASADQPASKE